MHQSFQSDRLEQWIEFPWWSWPPGIASLSTTRIKTLPSSKVSRFLLVFFSFLKLLLKNVRRLGPQKRCFCTILLFCFFLCSGFDGFAKELELPKLACSMNHFMFLDLKLYSSLSLAIPFRNEEYGNKDASKTWFLNFMCNKVYIKLYWVQPEWAVTQRFFKTLRYAFHKTAYKEKWENNIEGYFISTWFFHSIHKENSPLLHSIYPTFGQFGANINKWELLLVKHRSAIM